MRSCSTSTRLVLDVFVSSRSTRLVFEVFVCRAASAAAVGPAKGLGLSRVERLRQPAVFILEVRECVPECVQAPGRERVCVQALGKREGVCVQASGRRVSAVVRVVAMVIG
jgi:hypothetical protein